MAPTPETDTPIYQQQVRIAAPPDAVFDLLVDADAMQRWMGVSNQLDPRPGGDLVINVTGTDVARGEYLVVDRPNRVVFSWGWEGSEAIPPGTSRVEVTLQAEAGGTLLELTHHACPAEVVDSHASGWQHYLERLAVAAIADAGPDPWVTPTEESS